jgi:hypothetical protein
VNTGPSEPCKARHEAGHAVIADGLGYRFISSPWLRMVRLRTQVLTIRFA